MKITEVAKVVSFLVKTDDEDNYIYTRYAADNWTVRISESDEPLYDCEEIENLYQDWLGLNNNICSKEQQQ